MFRVFQYIEWLTLTLYMNVLINFLIFDDGNDVDENYSAKYIFDI